MAPKDLWPFPGSRRTSGWTRARAVSWGRKQQVASNGKKLHDVGVFHDDWFRFWDPYINFLYSPYNWVGFHPLQQITSGVNWSLKSKEALKSQICDCSSSSSSSSLAFLFLLFFEIDGDNSFSSLHDHPSGAGGPSEIFLEAYKHGSSTNKIVTQQITHKCQIHPNTKNYSTQITSLLESHVAIRYVKQTGSPKQIIWTTKNPISLGVCNLEHVKYGKFIPWKVWRPGNHFLQTQAL